MLFIPSMMNSDIGLLEPGTNDKTVKYDGPWKDYHEGIVTSSWFNFDKAYRTVSMVPSYRDVEFDNEVSKKFSAGIYEYRIIYVGPNTTTIVAKNYAEVEK